MGESKRRRRGEEEALQRSVDRAVPDAEQLPEGAEENPLSEHVEDVAEGAKPGPGATTFEGGEAVAPDAERPRDG
jgi:hypothetical protein